MEIETKKKKAESMDKTSMSTLFLKLQLEPRTDKTSMSIVKLTLALNPYQENYKIKSIVKNSLEKLKDCSTSSNSSISKHRGNVSQNIRSGCLRAFATDGLET